MQNNYQEIIDLVAKKCQEVLAPLYAELEELRAKYYPAEPKVKQPTPEEVEDAELEEKRKEWQKLANELREQGKIQ
ncbi:MAG: hypothetical protein IJZ50_05950 [Alistipes sp.]|nr:hypothetical protein [Alistipes sp.]MBQ8775373.1 hypothetical protein [Alistipes sp.]